MTIDLLTKEKTVQGQETGPASAVSNTWSQTRRAADAWLIALATFVFAVFTIGTLVSTPNQIAVEEKRKLAELPKFRFHRLAEFRDGFDSFFNDRLLGREQLIKVRACEKYLLWGVSTTPKFTAGKDGWLYLISNWCGPDVRHEYHMTAKQLDAWERVLKYRTEFFQKRGIHYVFLVAPNKDSIYPEYLPKAYEPINPLSRLDELTLFLKDRTGFFFVNPQADILRGKTNDGQYLYAKTDTHWNAVGALYAYDSLLAVLRRWYPSLTSLSPADFTRTYKKSEVEDMLIGMGLLGLLKEDLPILHGKESTRKPLLPIRVTMLHDSFGPCLKQFVERDFASVTYHHKTDLVFDLEEIASEKPDLVVEEVVERHVAQVVPSICDWQKWAIDTISRQSPGQAVWLDIVPNTALINVRSFSAYSQSGGKIQPVTCRVYTEQGEVVAFDPQKVLYHDWYLLKNGEQGAPFLNEQSRTQYGRIIDYITGSGKFEQVADCPMADGSTLTLYRKR